MLVLLIPDLLVVVSHLQMFLFYLKNPNVRTVSDIDPLPSALSSSSHASQSTIAFNLIAAMESVSYSCSCSLCGRDDDDDDDAEEEKEDRAEAYRGQGEVEEAVTVVILFAFSFPSVPPPMFAMLSLPLGHLSLGSVVCSIAQLFPVPA